MLLRSVYSVAIFGGMDLKTYLKETGTPQAELARRIDVTPGMVWQWLHGERRVAAEQVLKIEQATDGNVSRHELRPDLYPRDSAA
jgi:DNA-binding transcriptional regulator YdaS (Cro superfamily)